MYHGVQWFFILHVSSVAVFAEDLLWHLSVFNDTIIVSRTFWGLSLFRACTAFQMLWNLLQVVASMMQASNLRPSTLFFICYHSLVPQLGKCNLRKGLRQPHCVWDGLEIMQHVTDLFYFGFISSTAMQSMTCSWTLSRGLASCSHWSASWSASSPSASSGGCRATATPSTRTCASASS